MITVLWLYIRKSFLLRKCMLKYPQVKCHDFCTYFQTDFFKVGICREKQRRQHRHIHTYIHTYIHTQRQRKRKRKIKCGKNVSNHRESRKRVCECSLCYCLFILLLESEIFEIKTWRKMRNVCILSKLEFSLQTIWKHAS